MSQFASTHLQLRAMRHPRNALRALFFFTPVLFTGCGSALWNTAYRSEEFSGVKTIAVDAKQRFVFLRNDVDGKRMIVCPEPSPDALSAGGLTFSVDASKMSVADLRTALGTSEQSASIGLRTQSIQLLRDQLAYLCLMRLSEPDDKNQQAYVTMFKRYQSAVLGVLAIEQLTGAVKGPAVTVSASGDATVNVEKSSKATTGTPDAPAIAASAADKAASATDKAASAPEGGASAVGGEASADSAKNKGTKTKEKKTTSTVTATTRTGGASAPAPEGTSGTSSKTDMATVAETVYKIVDLIVGEAFGSENCAAVYSDPTSVTSSGATPRLTACIVRDKRVCLSRGQPIAACNDEAAKNLAVVQAYGTPEQNVALARDVESKTGVLLPIDMFSLEFRLLRCQDSDDKYLEAIRKGLLNAGIAGRYITRRSNAGTLQELVGQGFQFGAGVKAEIVYDSDIDREVKASAFLEQVAKQALKANGLPPNVGKNVNPSNVPPSPRSISIAVCSSNV